MRKEEFFSTFTHPKKDQHDIQKLISKYGENATLKQVLEDIYAHSPYKYLTHKCPKCNGTGYIVKEYNAYPSGLPDSGWVYEAGYDYKKCDLCDGMGWTETERKPITKVVGYE